MFLKSTRALLPALLVTTFCSVGSAEQPATVEIGAPIPITGPYAIDGQIMRKAIELAVDQLNAGGGLNGSTLAVRAFDIGDLTPDKLQAAASELIDRQGVAVLINGYGGMGPDIPAFCNRAQPYLNNNATTAVVELSSRLGCNNIFMATDVERSFGRATFEQISSLGLDFGEKRIAVLYGPYDWEVGFTDSVSEVAKADGWSVVLTEEIPYGTTQWGSMVQKLRLQRPDLIVFESLDPASISTFLDQFRKAPINNAIVYAGYSLSTPALAEMVATGSLDGVLGMSLSAQRPNEIGQDFSAAWEAKFSEQPPLSIAAQVYDEVMLWADAATRAGDATDFDLVREELMRSNFAGVTGTLAFTDQYYVPVGDDTQPSQLLQAAGGKVVPLRIGTQKTAEFTKPAWAN